MSYSYLHHCKVTHYFLITIILQQKTFQHPVNLPFRKYKRKNKKHGLSMQIMHFKPMLVKEDDCYFRRFFLFTLMGVLLGNAML